VNKKITICAATVALALFSAPISPAGATDAAPTYVESATPGVALKVLATSGDSFGNYQLAGVPDGTGITGTAGTAKLLVNHELSYGDVSKTLSRANGAAFGSTVSEVTINTKTQEVTTAKEFLKSALFYNYSTKTWGTSGAPLGAPALDAYGSPNHTNFLSRFCSASLSPAGRFAYTVKGKTYGIKDAVFLTGEESSDESRGFAVNAAGQIAQIPGFGLAAWETFNNIATGSLTTAVFGNEDGSATKSQLWLYQGKKTATGSWIQKAGLTNGKTYVMKIGSFQIEKDFRTYVGKNVPTAVSFQEINSNNNGVGQNAEADVVGTALARVEDGAFDPKDPSIYYFLTTESNGVATTLNPENKAVTKRDGGALWKLKLKDVKNPAAGGTITMLLDGSEAPYLNKPDNMEVDGFGNILIQEDPGNNAQLSRIVAYRIKDGKMKTVVQFKSSMFSAAAADASFITEDEESSGIIDVTNHFKTSKADTKKYYIFVAQVHATGDALLKARPDITTAEGKAKLLQAIEAGQIYLMTVSDWSSLYN
jgi:Bacterial protein of unknown function (DUF839)